MLKKCRECSKMVSTEAKTCPNCGVKRPTSKKFSLGVRLFVIFYILFLFVVLVSTSGPTETQNINQDSKSGPNSLVDSSEHRKQITLSKKERDIKKAVMINELQSVLFGTSQIFSLSEFNLSEMVSAHDLEQAYDQNEIAADNRFRGKRFIIKGLVDSIDKDFHDAPILRLKGGTLYSRVSAYMDRTELPMLLKMKKGDATILACLGGGYIMGSPVLRECRNIYSYALSSMEQRFTAYLSGRQADKKMMMLGATIIYISSTLSDENPCLLDVPACQAEVKDIIGTIKDRYKTPQFLDAVKRLDEAGLVPNGEAGFFDKGENSTVSPQNNTSTTNSPLYKTMPAEELRHIAVQGDPIAQYALSGRYEFGLNDVEQNKSEANMWQRKAFHLFEPRASNGDPVAQFYLGMMYKGGYGVSADRDKARGFLRKAAEQGVTRATETLWMDIMEHPTKDSFVWFQNAAVRGDTWAMKFLGTAYAEGKHVATDNTMSYMWYYLVAKDENSSGAVAPEAITEKMTSAQIRQAEQMATEWLKNNPRTIKPITLPY